MPADRELWSVVVRDPRDTKATRGILARIDDLERGVLVVRPVPGTRSPTTLAMAVLTALGKRVDRQTRIGGQDWWSLARAWTVGHQVNSLVIDRAHTLTRPLVQMLIELATAADAVGIWFIDASPHDTATCLANIGRVSTARVESLLNLCLDDPRRTGLRHRGDQIPQLDLPHHGFLTFRAACHRQLPAEHTAHVDAVWQATYETMIGWTYRTGLAGGRALRPDANELVIALPKLAQRLSVDLATQLYTAANPATALLRLRATQTALFRSAGLLLHHEPGMNVLPDQTLSCPLTADTAAAINRAVSTRDAIAAVLHLIYPGDGPYDGENRTRWRVRNIDRDGELSTAHGPIPVPACAQPILRAHLHLLTDTGAATPDDPLFGAKENVTELATRTLAHLDIHPANLQPSRYRRSRAYLRGSATPWMLQRGLELSVLADLLPRSLAYL